MKNTATHKHLIPSREVMVQMGYNNRAALLDFVKREGVPFYRLGERRIMFDASEVNSWLAHRKIGGL